MHGIVDKLTAIISPNASHKNAKLSLNEGRDVIKNFRFVLHRKRPEK